MMRFYFCDTFHGQPHEKYRAAFPKATFITHYPDGRRTGAEPHPHGGLAASCALIPNVNRDIEVHFLPFLDRNLISPLHAEDWLLDVLEGEKLTNDDFVNHSWGVTRPANATWDRAERTVWMPWVSREYALRILTNYWTTISSGNSERPDMTDVGYPASMMKDAVVVGVIDRTGKVVKWSPDGNIVNVDLGHYVWLLNPITGEWELGSGSSFSGPKTLGLLAWLVAEGVIHSIADYIAWLRANAGIPKGFTQADLPHPYFGYGETMRPGEKHCREIGAFKTVGLTARKIAALDKKPLRWWGYTDLKKH